MVLLAITANSNIPIIFFLRTEDTFRMLLPEMISRWQYLVRIIGGKKRTKESTPTDSLRNTQRIQQYSLSSCDGTLGSAGLGE